MSPPDAPTPIIPDPRRIIVPRRHGEILIEPPLQALHAALAAGPLDNPVYWPNFPALRSSARRHLADQLRLFAARSGLTPPPDNIAAQPWVLTGHQLEFYHAGVWAKVLAADALAQSSNALAIDILVDHDLIAEFGFDIPTQDGDKWLRRPVTWAAPTHLPADSLAPPTPDQFAAWDAQLALHPQTHTDTLAHLLADLNPAAAQQRTTAPLDYALWLSAARAKLERALGLNVWHVPTSLLCTSSTWQAFVRAWIENAEPWTASYNRHLAAYRAHAGIANPHHPMPDLLHTPTTLELPFWIYRPGQPRQRLFITRDRTALLHDNSPHPINSVLTPQPSSLVIRPRALTLTMYLRLFLADLFIHGIGGALYDQITDAILHELFGIIPPYACVSAAWLLPLGQPLEDAANPGDVRHRRHHLFHNPQLAINPFTALHTDVAELLRDRRELLASLHPPSPAAADGDAAKPHRAELFHRLHQTNAALHAKSPKILQRLDEELARANRAAEQNKVLLWREYFFALHTTASLQQLIQKIRTQ